LPDGCVRHYSIQRPGRPRPNNVDRPLTQCAAWREFRGPPLLYEP